MHLKKWGLPVLMEGGKTMAAEILGNHLMLDLYRIDLAGVVSKYIGETDKNIVRVFDAVEQSRAVLFFDEADALFGKRTDSALKTTGNPHQTPKQLCNFFHKVVKFYIPKW